MYLWSGKSLGVQFSSTRDAEYFLKNGLQYSSLAQTGLHERQVTLLDGKGNTICQSNKFKFEFADSAVDQTCTNLSGVIAGANKELCNVDSWTLFREMSKRNLVVNTNNSQPGYIGMANPASVNCAKVGKETSVSTSSGSYGVCSVDKFWLFKNIK